MKPTCPAESTIPCMTIEAGLSHVDYLRELYHCWELCYFLAWRDIKVRYKQAVFGLAWAIVRPLITMAFFTLMFSKIAKLPADNVNYPLFVLIGMIVWQLVSTIAGESATVLLGQAPMITKIYFPRLVIPISLLIVNVLDFLICYTLFLLGMWITGTPLYWSILFTPLFVLHALLLSLALSFWCSALTVRYRDFRFVVALAVQFSLLFSPVGYATAVIPEYLAKLYALNPLVGIIDGLRWCTFHTLPPHLTYSISLSAALTIFLLVTGFCYFRQVERTIADVI